MSAINELPTDKDFGLGFNYTVWQANTTITLANVTWDASYLHITKFANQNALDDFISNNSGPTRVITQVSYAKFGRPVRLPIPIEIAQGYNYLRVQNPAQPIPGSVAKSLYYFIVDVDYGSPNSTNVYLQLDIWATFGFGVTFGQCYIERSHLGIAASNSFEDNGREFLAIPEGLDIGGEYQIVNQYQEFISSARNSTDYSVLVMSTVDLEAEPGTIDDPNLTSAKGTIMENLPGGSELWVFQSGALFKEFMENMSDKPWVTQGIISITAIPNFARYSDDVEIDVITIGGVPAFKIKGGALETKQTNLKSNFRNDIFAQLGSRYWYLKKFATFPYSVLELTTYSGTPIIIKPENWNSQDAIINEIPHFVPPGARIMFAPHRYNAGKNAPAATYDSHGLVNDGGEFLDMCTGIFNFPTFSVVNNSYMGFLAANKNSLAFQHQSADWSQQKALAGNELSYDQASAGIDLSKNLLSQQMNAQAQSTNLANQASMARAIQGGINSIGALGNGPQGAIGVATGIANTAIGTTIDINVRNQEMGISQGLAQGQNRATTDNSAYMRDTNKNLADFAARGDYSNTIAGIAARVQDAKLTQPTTSGQIGGDAFNLARYKWGYDLKLKMLSPAAMKVIGEFWLRYGYAVQLYKTPPANLQVMTSFTYWKMKETNIRGNIPEPMKQAIRGIFEKGVTVWNDPNEIGVIDMAINQPLATEAL